MTAEEQLKIAEIRKEWAEIKQDMDRATAIIARLQAQNACLVAALRDDLYVADIYRKKDGDGLMVSAFADMARRNRALLSEVEGA